MPEHGAPAPAWRWLLLGLLLGLFSGAALGWTAAVAEKQVMSAACEESRQAAREAQAERAKQHGAAEAAVHLRTHAWMIRGGITTS